MKICRNNFDIYLYHTGYCSICSFKIGYVCKWLHIVGNFKSKCGGVKSNNLSDIFTL